MLVSIKISIVAENQFSELENLKGCSSRSSVNILFSYLGFLSGTLMIHIPEGEGKVEAISLALLYHFHPPHKHFYSNYCRELTFAHSYQPDLLITKLHVLNIAP